MYHFFANGERQPLDGSCGKNSSWFCFVQMNLDQGTMMQNQKMYVEFNWGDESYKYTLYASVFCDSSTHFSLIIL